ncbi:hypothetical protein CJ030_MR2G022294 [Morella rubra]|uniref:Uncharacterized protein n=1 Tax=Morella rubra TaxID=262757 RepID=A0A6A1WD68_9ROSI|nr:hypothetical protein CJ030_MR2G022294 [Morella rubra]
MPPTITHYAQEVLWKLKEDVKTSVANMVQVTESLRGSIKQTVGDIAQTTEIFMDQIELLGLMYLLRSSGSTHLGEPS